jgi:hypothetical protein
MPLQKLPTVDLDNVNHRRRARETINHVLDHSFDDSRVQTTAEKLAGINPVNYAYAPGDVRRYGSTLDYTPIANALLQAAQSGGVRIVRLAPNVEYDIGANTITLPDNVALDSNGSGIRTTAASGMLFGNGSAWYGYEGAYLITSGASGDAIKKNAASSNSFYIYGWPLVLATTTGVAGSRGVNFNYGYKGIFEVAVEGYEVCIVGGDGNPAHATYYNEIRSPRVRCTSGLIGIQLREGCNGTSILNPQVNGANAAQYGIYVDGAASLSIVGGYVEAFLDNAATRGLYFNNVSNATVVGTTVETIASTTANFAIGTTGTCDNVKFIGLGFAGAWGDSTKIMSWGAIGKFTFIGGAPTNQISLVGAASWIGSELNGVSYATYFELLDGVTGPSAISGRAIVYVDSSDGDLKIRFGNGNIKKIALDTAAPSYTVTNPATDRALNVTADTLPQVAAVLGTLIADLQAQGIIS